jgi:hypothetical protein
MGKHMLIYHLGIPVALFVALLIFGMPSSSAFGVAMAAGCASMVLMMFSGGGRPGQRSTSERSADPNAEPLARGG